MLSLPVLRSDLPAQYAHLHLSHSSFFQAFFLLAEWKVEPRASQERKPLKFNENWEIQKPARVCLPPSHTHAHTHTSTNYRQLFFYSLTFLTSPSQQKSAHLYTCWIVMKEKKSRIERKWLCDVVVRELCAWLFLTYMRWWWWWW